MKRVLLITDTHLEAGVEPVPAYQLAMKFAKVWKPDVLIHLGDIADWDFISSFSRDLVGKLEGKSFKREFATIAKALETWQTLAPEVILLAGNHDERVYAALDRAPGLKGYVEYENALDLKMRGVPFLRPNDQPYKLGKLHLIHGWYTTANHAKRHLDAYSGNIAYGHLHVFQTASKVLAAAKQEIQAWAIGCLCDKNPDYLDGAPSGWQHGVAAVYVHDNGNFNLYPINIIKDAFIFEGKEWKS